MARAGRYRRGSVSLELSTAATLLGRLFLRELGAAGLRPVDGSLLALVHIHGPVTPTALERESGIAQTTLRERLQALIDAGYVERLPNEDDRRSYFVDSTPAGERYLDEAVPAMRAVEEAVERELGRPLEELRAPLEELRVAAQRLLDTPH